MLKTVQKERIKLILGYNRNLCVRFHASLQIPCVTWVIQLILLAHPCPWPPWPEWWDLGEMLGEVRYSPETGTVRGKLANSGAEQTENSPRDASPGNTSPVADENLLLSARGHLTLLGLAGRWICGYICSALILVLTCLLLGAVREEILGYMGLRSATVWPVLCFQTKLVLINSFKDLYGKTRN